MAVSVATCHLETYGLRLTCACGAEQYYAGVDAYTSICNTCAAHYRIAQTSAGYAVEEVDV